MTVFPFTDRVFCRRSYGPLARERVEQEEREKRELEKRERELKDFEFKSRMQAAMSERPPLFDPNWMELQRRFGVGGNGSGSSSSAPGTPGGPSSSLVPPFGMFPPPSASDRDRLGLPPGTASQEMHNLAAAERLHNERLAAMDPIMRLQMANLASELSAHSHAHTHAHGKYQSRAILSDQLFTSN